MQQMTNVIRIEEGGVSNPYLVIERFSHSAAPNIPNGYKLIREQRNGVASLLLCKPVPDATWSDIETDDKTNSHTDPLKGSHVDSKV